MRTWLVVVWLGCGACFAKIGPNAGYDVKKGWFAGIEAGAGFVIPEAVVGYQSSGNMLYGRIDADFDDPGGAGARIGGGGAFSATDEYDPHGMFVAGADVNFDLAPGSSGRCAGFPQAIDAPNRTVFEVGFELRYLSEWQLVLTSQVGCMAGHVSDD